MEAHLNNSGMDSGKVWSNEETLGLWLCSEKMNRELAGLDMLFLYLYGLKVYMYE